ncbi:MAG: serine/threonine protein kinase [Limisphaerales bacterium]
MTHAPGNRNWIAPLLVAALIAAFGFWCNARVRKTIESQLKADLTTAIDANVTALEIWITNQFNLATSLSSEPRIHELALKALLDPEATGTLLPRDPNPDRPATPTEEFDQILRPRLEQVGYRIAHLVDTNLGIVAGTGRGRFRGRPTVLDEHTNSYQRLFASSEPILITPFRPFFRGARQGRPPNGPPRDALPDRTARPPSETVGFGGPPFSGPRQRPVGFGTNRPPGPGRFSTNGPPGRRGDLTLMQVAVPIRDESGQVRGGFAVVIDPEREFTRILSVARPGISGETYALDQRGLLISRSRFDEQLRRLGLIADHPDSGSALNLRLSDPGEDEPARIEPDDPNDPARPLTHLAAAAVSGGSGVDVATSRDYRGVPVVGAWRWLPQHGFGVVTQINATEAYQPLRVLNLLFLILFLLLLLCSTGMLLVSGANLAWRRRLNEAELKLRQLGQYTLQEKIGEGAMGVVYRGRHGLLRRDTAIKLLLPDRADPESIGRFEREVCLSCQLTHPNTIQVFDYGRTPDGIFYYAMEYLRGLNLHDLVARFGPQPEARVAHILIQICDSLSEAHALGLVHRDIKPANVFLCHRGGIADCVKVLDFGLVREFRSELATRSGSPSTIEGTPSFIPPEAIDNRSPIDPRSDLYSVGALGYYLVTGQPVFDAENAAELYQKHLTEIPVPPGRRTTNPIGREFEVLLLDCLAKDPADRPESAQALRRRLKTLPTADEWDAAKATAWWEANRESSSPESTPPAVRKTPAPIGGTRQVDKDPARRGNPGSPM